MTPREELLRGFDTLVDNYHASRQETRAMLNQYAIGRWVPVEERLPDTGERTYWDGIVLQDGDVEIGTFGDDSFRPESTNITHWLELDIPEVSQ